MIHDDKPGLNELAHYGVRGMKWGQRKAQDDAAGRTGSFGRPTKAQIKGSRANRHSGKASDRDRVNSLYMTRGEQAVSIIVGGPIGLVAIAGLGGARTVVRNKTKQGG